ncbi:MAG: hydantoinase/oxoprolinase family protein [Chloroflexi bacterium]|nr:hydantoinase/oxoprolinase family protein [Chloroflexota bacterium]
MRRRLAVDIGGTFTDLVLFDHETRELRVAKSSSSPDALADGVLACLASAGVELDSVEFFVHGTTVGLNAILEGKGVPTGLVTTRGFRDVYAIGRMDKPDMYSYVYEKPRPLAPRDMVFEVDERIDAFGRVLAPLDAAEVEAVAGALKERGVRSVAVCTLHAYANPAHELGIGRILEREINGVSISLSHEVSGEWREYERTSTVVMNAYLQPLITAYLEDLERQLARRGYRRSLYVMQCNGGIMDAALARARSIQTLLSGPAGGAIGASQVARRLGDANMISLDMGGTSCDVSLVIDGEVGLTTDSEIKRLPVLVPMLQVNAIGAGGGSLARVEIDGSLRVGPQSAGARPGPACYGRGGREPTVTDANLALGRISADTFAHLGLEIRPNLAADAVTREVARPLGMDVEQAAEGIVRLVTNHMANAVRDITIGRGLSPKDFSLLAFGGAGPMHAVGIAREIGVSKVVVPPAPGTFSAWGMLFADFRQDLVRTVVLAVEPGSMGEIESQFAELEAGGRTLLLRQDVLEDSHEFVRQLDLRYRGQEHTLTLPVPPEIGPSAVKESFDEAHRRVYGYDLAEPIEIVNLRLAARGAADRPELKPIEAAEPGSRPTPNRRSPVYFEDAFCDTPHFDRGDLRAGHALSGPAIVTEASSTTVIPPGASLTVDAYGLLIVDTDGGTHGG